MIVTQPQTKTKVRSPRRWLLAWLLLIAVASPVVSSSVKVFEQQSQKAFLEGTFEGISVDPLGTLRLADRVERVVGLEEQPFVFQLRSHPEGFVLGTGNAGEVILVTREGTKRTLFKTEEPEVFAVLALDDGTVLAGSSPDGKVYRLAPGATEPEVLFDPEDTYIWSLERLENGDLVVATGPEGRLYKLSAESMTEQLPVERATVLYDSDDPHIRSLHVLPDGRSLLVGTAGNGLVLEIDASGTTRTLYDAAQPEIIAFAVGADGARYVAALATESSLVSLSAARSTSSNSNGQNNENGDDKEGEVSVTEGSAPSGSRPSGFTGARSIVVRLDAGGAVETLWRFEKETIYDLVFARDRLWVATGLDGKLFSWQADQMVLEKAVDEKQIIGLLADRTSGPEFATTNAGAIYRLVEGTEREGQYTSQVLDASRRARFGTLHWEGELPRGTKIEWQVRSGTSAKPDATWTDWSVATSADALDLAGLPRGRYAQWRATLHGSDGRTPRIERVELSYLEANQKPEITELTVLEPGQILVPANFNPSNQVYEPVSPNRDGIFTSVDGKRKGEAESKRTKKLWKKGYRTLSWTATDPNEDDLRYALHFRPEGDDPETASWLLMAEELEDPRYAFDATALPDGRYRFRVTASDRLGNEAGDALEAQHVSESVLVDNAVPTLGESTRDGNRLEVTVTDQASPIRTAEWSENAREWQKATVVDGLLDGRVERLQLELTADARFVLLRVTDAAHNVVTYSLAPN